MKFTKEKNSHFPWYGYSVNVEKTHGLWIRRNSTDKLEYNIEKEDTTLYIKRQSIVRLYI